MRLRFSLPALVLAMVLAPIPVMAAPPYVAIEKRLSAEQLHATGLDTLSAEQMALLNRLLSEEIAARDRDVARDSVGLKEKRSQDEAFVAIVKGNDLRGWSKGDVVELDNGQRWRVVDGELYMGRGASNPKVSLTPGALGSWYLQVEGQSPRLKVQRVR